MKQISNIGGNIVCCLSARDNRFVHIPMYMYLCVTSVYIKDNRFRKTLVYMYDEVAKIIGISAYRQQ